MNALLGQEAKWYIALAGSGRVKARNCRGNDGRDLFAARHRR